MSKQRDSLAARMARAAAPAADAPAAPAQVRNSATPQLRNSATPQARRSAPAQVRTDPIKVSVTLQPMEYRDLGDVIHAMKERTGLLTIANAEVFRRLLAIVAGDLAGPFAAQLAAELLESGGSQR